MAKAHFVDVVYSFHRKIVTTEMEADLKKHLTVLCDRFYGLTRDKARAFAYEFITKNSIDISSRWKKWLRSFIEKNKIA